MSATYVTTPIYYVNDRPHIGHAYSTVAADLCCRYARLRGAAAWLLTGTDEHGQKVERRAREEGLEPQDFVDRMLPPFRALPALMHCDIDDFIRTTEPRHKRAVQALWQRLEAAGDIYLGEYEGWYSVHSEAFYTEKDLLDGKLCPVSKKPVERVKEKSYFFRLSKYTEPLLQHYEAHPDFVQPVGRFNEVKRFVAEGLHDLSISRTSFRWGVPVASCPEHVMYVWLDALTNYLSALGAPAAGETTDPRFAQWWPPAGRAVHIVGKDILRFHAVYWPAFLLSAGLPLPTQVWAHGWLTVNGEKMSKSSGNFIPPDAICNALGADVLRYYLMREVAFGQDGDFSHPKVLARYHGDLGNGLGNLLQRMLSGIVAKHLDGRVPIVAVRPLEGEDKALAELAQDVAGRAAAHYAAMAPQRALEAIWELVFACNRYVDQMAPWALAKAGDKVRLGQVCYHVLETLRWLSVMLWPCMPEKADALRQQLGLGALLPNVGQDVWPSVWGGLGGGGRTQPGPALFPRFEGVQEQELLARMGYVDAAQAARMSTSSSSAQASASAQAAQGAAKRGAQGAASTAQAPTPSGAQAPAKAAAQTLGTGKAQTGASGSEADALIDFDAFLRVQLRLATVLEAVPVPKSKKLLRLQVDLGENKPRQILAGIGQHYQAADLVGRQVVVVANLKPRKMMGLDSQGMVLAVSDAEGLNVLSPARPFPAGTTVG